MKRRDRGQKRGTRLQEVRCCHTTRWMPKEKGLGFKIGSRRKGKRKDE